MNIKKFRSNKYYSIGVCLILLWYLYIVYSTSFWKLGAILMTLYTSMVLLIFLFSRFTLSDNFVEEKIITTKKIRLSEIDCVIYKKLFQDCTICLKNGRRHKIVFQFNNFDLEYFFEYLEKNGIEVIKRH